MHTLPWFVIKSYHEKSLMMITDYRQNKEKNND